MARDGFFVTFEGLDGCGKTTQIEALSDHLRRAGRDFIVTRQPGGTALGERIRAVLLDSNTAGIAPLAELTLMFADRIQSLEQVILPALAGGKIVLCDRFTDSSEAYQGGGRGLGSAVVRSLHRLLCGDIQPDLTFLLVADPTVTVARALDRSRGDLTRDETRFEQEEASFHARVLAAYLQIAERARDRVVQIDASQPIDTVQAEIIGIFEERIAARQRTLPSVP